MENTEITNDSKDEGDQIPNPRKKAHRQLIENIPGITKFEKFQHMRGMGFNETQIKQALNIKTDDAFRMMDNRAHDIVQSYLRYQAKTGHMQNLVTSLVMMWQNVFDLKEACDDAKMLRKNHPDETKYYYPESHFRTAYSNALNDVFQLQHKTPLADALNQFVKENMIEGIGNRSKSKNIGIWPKGLKN
jgi:hypothetical protein